MQWIWRFYRISLLFTMVGVAVVVILIVGDVLPQYAGAVARVTQLRRRLGATSFRLGGLEYRVRDLIGAPVVFGLVSVLLAVCTMAWVRPEHVGMWESVYLTRAQDLRSGLGYLPTYPLWGYPVLAAGALAAELDCGAARLLTTAQVLCGFLLLQAMYMPVLRNRAWWVGAVSGLLTLPVMTGLAQPTADAVYLVGILAVLAAFRAYQVPGYSAKARRGSVLLCAVFWGLAANMRSEALLIALILAMLLLPIALVPLRSAAHRRAIRSAALFWSLMLAGALVGLTPWYAHTIATTGQGLWGATNSGHVLWVSLGQLPDNPWNRIPKDEAATAYAKSKGLQSSMSVAGDREMRRAFEEDVRRYPRAFAQKVILNARDALWGGPPFSLRQTSAAAPLHPRIEKIVVWAESITITLYRWMLPITAALLIGVVTIRQARRRIGAGAVWFSIGVAVATVLSVAILSVGLWVPRLGTPIVTMVIYTCTNMCLALLYEGECSHEQGFPCG